LVELHRVYSGDRHGDMEGLLDEEGLFESDEEEEKKRGENDRPVDDKKALFKRELRSMLYGFGDDKVPFEETLELLEQIVVAYIRELSARAMEVGKAKKVALEDIHYLIRRDAKKFGRVKDLLSMSEELKRARKAFDEAKAI